MKYKLFYKSDNLTNKGIYHALNDPYDFRPLLSMINVYYDTVNVLFV